MARQPSLHACKKTVQYAGGGIAEAQRHTKKPSWDGKLPWTFVSGVQEPRWQGWGVSSLFLDARAWLASRLCMVTPLFKSLPAAPLLTNQLQIYSRLSTRCRIGNRTNRTSSISPITLKSLSQMATLHCTYLACASRKLTFMTNVICSPPASLKRRTRSNV